MMATLAGFGFGKWQAWLGEQAAVARSAGFTAERRAGGPPTHKPCCSFRIKRGDVLAQFDVWATGEADFDIMAGLPGKFVDSKWGAELTDMTFETAFADFLGRVQRAEVKSPP